MDYVQEEAVVLRLVAQEPVLLLVVQVAVKPLLLLVVVLKLTSLCFQL